MKTIYETKAAPAPIGPYSQAVRAGDILFCSGQVAIVPETGELELSSIQSETHQVMKNIKALLAEAGVNLSQVVKSSIFLSDMRLFAEMNEVYASYFTSDFPARETVAVKELPKSVNVEISVTVYMG
jgi:2-iminobutanoate/2-iminopropanoate deaminase|tara:strand:- start:287 stop:667 length:381 start_codon:yes stop_codon:yes gene_type:complete